MDFWDTLTDKVQLYMNTRNENDLEEIISFSIPYLKKYAFRAQKEAQQSGVYIPFEDFYSNLMYTTWKTVKNYSCKDDFTFQRVLRHRLFFSKCNVWRTYKTTTNDSNDKDGVSYVKSRWSSLETIDEKTLKISPAEDERLILLEALSNYSLADPKNYQFLNYLIYGDTPLEALKKVGLCPSEQQVYSDKFRKKVERIRKNFRNYLTKFES